MFVHTGSVLAEDTDHHDGAIFEIGEMELLNVAVR